MCIEKACDDVMIPLCDEGRKMLLAPTQTELNSFLVLLGLLIKCWFVNADVMHTYTCNYGKVALHFLLLFVLFLYNVVF